jgi:carboxylesterase type B
MQILFGTSEDVSGIATIATQEQLTEVMQKALVAFADDPVSGLEGFRWPRYAREKETLVRLGCQNSAVPDFVRPEVYSWNCSNVVLAGGQ